MHGEGFIQTSLPKSPKSGNLVRAESMYDYLTNNQYYLTRVGFSLTKAPQPPFLDFLLPDDEADAAGVFA